MRVVFDTSLLVAAARSKSGASHALLSRMPDARFQPVVSVPLFIEYRTVLLRAGCRYIVTHNLRDFRGTEQWGIAAVTPDGFLKLINKTS